MTNQQPIANPIQPAAGNAAPPSPAAEPDYPEHWSFGTPLKERAWALYCQGYHSPSIGRQLGVPERTVRSWLAKQFQALTELNNNMRRHQYLLAIHRQRGIVMAAWKGYERALALEEQSNAAAESDDAPTAARAERAARQALSAGARYLTVVVAAEREIARLQNLYNGKDDDDLGPTSLVLIRRPDGPENIPPPNRPGYEDHVETPTPSTDTADHTNTDADHSRQFLAKGDNPATSALAASPLPVSGRGLGERSNEIAAKTATTSDSPPPHRTMATSPLSPRGKAGQTQEDSPQIEGDARFTRANPALSATTSGSPSPRRERGLGGEATSPAGEDTTSQRRQIHFPWPAANIGCIM